jgi:hypothetical protein
MAHTVKTGAKVPATRDETMDRAGVESYTVESPFENSTAIEMRKAGRAPQTEEQPNVTLTVVLSRIWRDHTQAYHICVTATKRETALEVAEAAYRALVKQTHPDLGGNHARMVVLNAAIETIRTRPTARARSWQHPA